MDDAFSFGIDGKESFLVGKTGFCAAGTAIPSGLAMERELRSGDLLVYSAAPNTATTSIIVASRGGFPGEKKEGLTNFFQNVLLSETAGMKRKEIVRNCERIGASLFPVVSREWTGVGASFPSQHILRILELLQEVLTSSKFSKDEIEISRRNILYEIEGIKDDPYALSMKKLRQVLFPGHYLGREFIGEKRSVNDVGKEDLEDFCRDNLQSKRRRIVIVSDIGFREVRRLTNRYLCSLFNPSKREESLQQYRGRLKSKRLHYKLDREQTVFKMAFEGVPQTDHYYPHSLLFLSTIGYGASSRLWSILRDRRSLTYSASASGIHGPNVGRYVVHIACKPAKLDRTERGIREVLEELKEKGVERAELNARKNFLVGSLLRSMESNLQRALFLISNSVFGLPLDFQERTLEAVREIRLKEFNEFLRERVEITPTIRVSVGRPL